MTQSSRWSANNRRVDETIVSLYRSTSPLASVPGPSPRWKWSSAVRRTRRLFRSLLQSSCNARPRMGRILSHPHLGLDRCALTLRCSNLEWSTGFRCPLEPSSDWKTPTWTMRLPACSRDPFYSVFHIETLAGGTSISWVSLTVLQWESAIASSCDPCAGTTLVCSGAVDKSWCRKSTRGTLSA